MQMILVHASDLYIGRASDLRFTGHGFMDVLFWHLIVALSKLLTPVCLLSPGSVIWYQPRAVMLFGWENNCGPGVR